MRNSDGRPDSTSSIVIFPTERDLWMVRSTRRIRVLRVSELSTYAMRGLPGGDYLIAAIPDVDLGDFPEPKTLEALARIGNRISLGAGERKSFDLTVKGVK